jgi:hypothetical protein
MSRIYILAFFALNVLVSCVSHVANVPYQPATKPEKIEFAHDRLDIYPDDFRKNPMAHSGVAVAWAGIIRSTEAYEKDVGDKIVADTVFEQHYFDWVQDGEGQDVRLAVSPRGEGLFRTRWTLDKTIQEAGAKSAERYAAPGKLAIVYGVPESVDTNGTVVLKYRYLRILGVDHFSTNQFDYGRLGEPFTVLHSESAAPRIK